jgi:hypothetical protein
MPILITLQPDLSSQFSGLNSPLHYAVGTNEHAYSDNL